MPELAALDWIVLCLYGVLVVGIGVVAHRGQEGTEDYLLAGRNLRWWAVGVSLIATSFSSAALIGGTGIGFSRGLSYLQLQLGDLLAIGVAAWFFLPFFSRLRVTTAYEYLEDRFGVFARSVASALFLVQTVLRAGTLVWAPALALQLMTGMSVTDAILLTAGAAVLYSAFGGIAAVVWTDLVQLVVIVFTVVLCLILVDGQVPGGFSAVLQHASESGRLHVVDPAFDRASILNLPGALLAYGTLALSIAGTNQQVVQRYMSCRDLSSARRAAMLGWGIGFVAVGLTVFLGVCLHAWSELVPGSLVVEKPDQVLPAFGMAELPVGARGLLLAAVFAASMSSLDSAIHSMSTCVLVDFVRRFGSGMRERWELLLARGMTVVFGGAAVVFALVLAESKGELLLELFTWLSYFAGPLLGLFLLGMTTRRVGEGAALVGVVLGFVVVAVPAALGWPKEDGFHALWLAPVALVATIVCGGLASLVGRGVVSQRP